jgi:hypothetical protein
MLAGILLAILITWTIFVDGFDGDEFGASAKAAVGVVVMLGAAKGTWVLMSQGTLLTIISGLGLLILAAVAAFGILVAIGDIF